MIDLRKEDIAEGIEEKHYLVMPFNNKWYKLKMRFTRIYENSIGSEARERCENIYRRICSDYANKNIAIMEIETGQTFVFNSHHDGAGNLEIVTCNDFSQFEQMSY